MTTKEKQLVKATVPVLRENGVLLTSHFYRRMFQHNPELRHMFNMGNQQNQKQQAALAMAVLAYAEHIENPSVLMTAVDHIGQKHSSLDVRPEHYSIVGRHLIASISEVLGEAASPELLEAWGKAYQQLAGIMVGHEQGLYNQQTEKKGGWTGWRPFVVEKKIKESEEITSFYLKPSDGGNVADFKPGQYISLRLFLPELNLMQPRQYSLSCAPNGHYYRISVKREKGDNTPDGMISNRLHDHVKESEIVELSAPAGTFVLQESANPKVFISGGVGQTPLMSMLEQMLNNEESSSPITWVHGCRNEGAHAFRGRLKEIANAHQTINQYVFYDSPDQTIGTTLKGMVELDRIKEQVLQGKAEYYICGPAPFIEKHYHYLLSNGIPKSQIYFEEFGPTSLHLN